MNFIELTDVSDGSPILINVSKIRSVELKTGGVYKGFVFVAMYNDKRGQFGHTVSESYKEVKARIAAATE